MKIYMRWLSLRRIIQVETTELAFCLPEYPRWDLMLRIHHRSGAKEVIGEGVSNYLCVGLKLAF